MITPPAALSLGLRISRAVRRGRVLLAGRTYEFAVEGLERHGADVPSFAARGQRAMVAALDLGVPAAAAHRLGAAVVGAKPPPRATQLSLDDLGRRYIPGGRAIATTLAALLLAACVAPEVTVDAEPTPPPEVYSVEADATTQRKVTEVHAEARCEAGDVVLGGGCSWGARRSPETAYPLEPVEDRPSDDGEGWLCVGQQDGVGVELETLRASAVCLVVGGVS